MSNVAKNQYHDLAEQIMAEEQAGPAAANQAAPAGEFNQDEFVQKFIAERQAAWEADETGSEVGFDSETLQMLTDELDGEGVAAMPAEQIMAALMRSVSPEEAQYYDSLDPASKLEMLEAIIESDGLGSIKSFMEGGEAASQGQQ